MDMRNVLWVACVSLLASCGEKVESLHFNEAEQVFEIGTPAELRYLSRVAGEDSPLLYDVKLKTDAGREVTAAEARIRLVNDVEIDGEWTPIRFSVKELDGNGHTITFDGVELVADESDNDMRMGLFETLGKDSGTVVKNLTLAGDMTVDATGREQSYSLNAGALAGVFADGSIEDCTNRVNIRVRDKKGLGNIELGGLVGTVIGHDEAGFTLDGRIVNEADLTVEGCREVSAGGVIGDVSSPNAVTAGDVLVENKGNISVIWFRETKTMGSDYVGGVFGNFKIHSGEVEHLHNSGNIMLDTQQTATTLCIGGVCGSLTPEDYNRLDISDLYNSGTIEIKGDVLDKLSCVGGVVGCFGGSNFHRVVNEGRIVLSGGNSGSVGGLLGDENMLNGNSYLYSCCEDKATDHPKWNVSRPQSRHAVCQRAH